MDPLDIFQQRMNRRQFLAKNANGLGKAALASLFGGSFLSQVAKAITTGDTQGIAENLPNFAPKAKRAIFLFMAGAPSQIDLWDYKPNLGAMFDKDLPASVINGQRLTGNDLGTGPLSYRPLGFQVQPIREIGHVGQRTPSLDFEDR